MRIRLSEFRAIINKFISEAMEEMEQESVDRLNRHASGYDDSEFDESVDRLNRARDGYGETEFEEGAGMLMPGQSSCSSQENEAAGVGPKDPTAKPQSAGSSAALHTRDKSQMQGVGPRPTMATAFGDQNQQKKEDEEHDPNKTAVLTPGQRPDSERAERQFMAGQKAKKAAHDKEQIKTISQQHQAAMQKDGWKFDRHPSGNGNWTATPPAVKKQESAFSESKKLKKTKKKK